MVRVTAGSVPDRTSARVDKSIGRKLAYLEVLDGSRLTPGQGFSMSLVLIKLWDSKTIRSCDRIGEHLVQ